MAKRHYGVRTERYKLIHFYYDVDEWELYDLETDQSEMNNVYGDPAYSEVQATLHRRLVDLREKYNDPQENDQKFLEQYLEWRKSRK
jgi:arylsulfatase A-like enzyme